MPNRREDDGSRSVASVADAIMVAKALRQLPVAFVARDLNDEANSIVTVATTETELHAAAEEAFRHNFLGRIQVGAFGPPCFTGITKLDVAQTAADMLGYPNQLVAESPPQGAALAIVARKKPDVETAFRRALAVSATRRVAIRKWPTET